MDAKMSKDRSLIPLERIERSILLIRGHKVMLDRDLAYLYGVTTKVLNQAVKRHKDRFPEDFMFQLTMEEAKIWWTEVRGGGLRSQIVILKRGEHIKYCPYAFTEHGILMLSSVLNSERAIKVNIEIMRAFVRLRRILSSTYRPEMADEAGLHFDHVVAQILNKDYEIKKVPERKACKECDLRVYCGRGGVIRLGEVDDSILSGQG
jgi:hypothetical protein